MSQLVARALPPKRKRIVNSRLRNRKVQDIHSPPEINKDGEKAETSLYFAGFWMRLWAFLLDMITVFSLNGLLVYPLLRLTNVNGLLSLGPFNLETVLSAVIFFLYFAIMTKIYGQTIGKMIMGLRVISLKNDELSWTQIIFREGVGRFIHQSFFLLYAIYVMVAFTTKKQGLHDVIADTCVIHEREEQSHM
ncbi:RDD family protein [Halalkalibacter alkaliphilus]|uniref:RDD family protein n=1 Tax=Halalkalibacter alkaliphilus TaxID=2917993 RepID=A0A9X2CT49_9BACI|nr:RDD family protein [Halalkalibacter alkaliphilus]MCL7747810.1 RDD family protein [Halalkalibacter alkaliphilus]